jgi:hypothetical protein
MHGQRGQLASRRPLSEHNKLSMNILQRAWNWDAAAAIAVDGTVAE